MTRKIINKNSPGTAATFAGDDWDYINKYLTGVDQSSADPVPIKTNTTFWDNRLKFYNPLGSKRISIRTLPFLNDYDLTLPLLSSNDEIVGLITAQQLQNKTININENTVKHGSTNAIGDLLVGNGTKYDRLAMSSNAGYHLAVKTDLSGLEWVSPTTGSGEINIGSNVGTAGVGPYLSKSGVTLRFKKINGATNGRIAVTDDTANNEIDIGIQGGTDGQFLKTVGTTPTWSTLTSQYGIVLPDGANFGGTIWGRFLGGAKAGDGLLAGMHVYGDISTDVQTNFTYTRLTTEASDDATAGFSTTNTITRRSQNPKFKMRFRHDLATEKGWTGFVSLDEIEPGGGSSDNPLENQSGLMAGYAETDANWLIRWNNGGATPQTYNTGVLKDTNVHTVELRMDNATASVTAIWDGATVVNASTTQVPGAVGLNLHNMVESVGGTAMPMRVEYAYITVG